MLRLLTLLSLLLLTTLAARADTVVLRMAAIAPDGTSWARELKAFARDVDARTSGAVKVKWYLGGIAGEEYDSLERIKRDQLDGAAGAMICDKLAPTLRVMRVPGLIRDRPEALHVINSLRAPIEAEFDQAGFVYLGAAGFGLDVLFSRAPVRTLADLKRGSYWVRTHDDVVRAAMTAIGMHIVETSHADAASAYQEGKVDGFIATPGSALAFQWISQVNAYTDLKLAYLTGCMTVSRRAFDKLSNDDKQAVRSAAAVLASRFEEVGRDFDRQLLDALFARRGLTRVAPAAPAGAEIEAALLGARAKIPADLVPRALLDHVLELIAHFRAGPH